MSLKSVELQIALPKTFDAGKMADNAQQLVHGNQAMAQMATERQVRKNRLTVLHLEETDSIDDEHPHKNREGSLEKEQHSKEQKQRTQELPAQHPFKGNFFDFSG
ncbi:hypothetical protein [Kurthia senegalensis]|uniref:hypothetical protein n=1 Tax=Kurthia senegalensis TaxID=1033740 RepID=UPI000289A002|nr:hypothetical protein [Kurthia senegalensis]